MAEMLSADLIQVVTLACIFVGVFMLITGMGFFFRRGENQAEARNRRLRMIRDGVSKEEIFALLRPETKTGLLGKIPGLAKFPKMLVQAGIAIAPQTFLTYCMLGVLAIASAAMLFVPVWQAVPFALLLGLGVPLFMVKSRCDELKAKLTAQLPDALELMARGLKIGHPVNTSIGAVADEMSDPIGSEFGVIFDQVSFGEELPDAVQEFADRVDTEDARYLAASIAIQHGTGGDLERIVSVLSTVVRKRIALRSKIKAISAEGRLSGLLLSIIPFVIIGLMSFHSPGYYTEMFDDPAFVTLAVVAGVLTVANIVVLHKLVNFRV